MESGSVTETNRLSAYQVTFTSLKKIEIWVFLFIDVLKAIVIKLISQTFNRAFISGKARFGIR